MLRPRRSLRCFGLFVLVYGLLITPWPGWNEAYAGFFRTVGRALFAEESTNRVVRFDRSVGANPALLTSITLANPGRADAQGRSPARILELDARGIGWVPTALFLALVIASPVPWKRRGWAGALGLVLLHGFIFFSVGCYIWNESTQLGLVSLSPFWKAVGNGLEETLITQLGASFIVPALLWLVVTFRVHDLQDLRDVVAEKAK